MKTLTAIGFLLTCFVFTSHSQNAIKTHQNTMEEISVVGVFDGKTIVVGNLTTETVYKINEYCIALADMSEAQAASFKGKKVLVTGKLKIVVGKYRPTKTSTDGKIYEPYKEPDKKFIVRPTFKVIE